MEKLTVREKAGFGIGEIASNVIWMNVMFFLANFYTDIFGIPAAVTVTMFMVVRLFDAVNDPIMGAIADRTKTRWGKFRPYILWMAVPFGVAGVLMFYTPDFSLNGKIIYAYITYILMMVIYTAMMIPYSALSGVMTSDYLDRTSLNSYRFVGAFLGGLLIQGLTLPMVDYLGENKPTSVKTEINGTELLLLEQKSGTAKVFVRTEDGNGGMTEDEFYYRVNKPGENPPVAAQSMNDTTLTAGFSEWHLPLNGYFDDPDGQPLSYKADVSHPGVLEAAVTDGMLHVTEKGAGKSQVTVTAEDTRWGQTNQSFTVFINRAGNTPPVCLAPDKRLNFRRGFKQQVYDLTQYFSDSDGDTLSFYVASGNDKVVTCRMQDAHIILTEKKPGKTSIHMEASDGNGGYTSVEWDLSIDSGGNNAPVVVQPLADVRKSQGFGRQVIDLSPVFTDLDGDSLTFSVSQVNEAGGYQNTMRIFAVLCVVFFLITFFTTKERIQAAVEKSRLWDDFKDLIRNVPWVLVFFISLVTLIYVSIRSAAIIYYFKYYIGNTALTSSFLVSGTLAIIVSLTLTKWLTKIFDKRKLYVICMTVVGLSALGFYMAGPTDIFLLYALQIIFSFASGPTMPLLWSMMADAADYSEWKTGRRATALVFSASTFAQKGGGAVGGAIAMWLLSYYGYIANVQQTARALYGMRMMLSVYPALGAFLCAFLVWFYRLDVHFLKKIQDDLIARKAK